MNSEVSGILNQYRVAQVLSSVSNKFWAFPALHLQVGVWILAEVVSLYCIIRLHNVMPVTMLDFFGIIALDGFVVVHLIFNLMSRPYLASIEFKAGIMKVAGAHKNRESKWIQKFVTSCSPIQLKMGDGNFFDTLTALNIWQFCVDNLITLSLL
jgi:hypothetical protein